MANYLLRLKEKGLRYWVTALIVFVLTITGAPYVYEYFRLTNLRSSYFQLLLDWGPRPIDPKFVRIVLVEDDDYWLGKPAGRRPLKRDYLAAIVDKLAESNVSVIALDLDERLPDPHSTNIPEDYQKETELLVQAISRAANLGVKVVLSTPLWTNDAGDYILDSDIYQAYGLCGPDAQKVHSKTMSGLRRDNVTCGYISLPDDPLVVPLQISMADGSELDSFALAISRAIRPEYVAEFLERVGTRTQYGNYISAEKFIRSRSTYSAHQVLQPDARNENLRANAVIVGGHWSTFAAGRGDLVDEHWSPVGAIVGAELHANFVEDILDGRTFGISPDWFLKGSEIALSLLAGISFALIATLSGKLLGIGGLLSILLFIQWSVLHLFGVFFDAFVPIVGLGLHALYDRLIGEEAPTRFVRNRKAR